MSSFIPPFHEIPMYKKKTNNSKYSHFVITAPKSLHDCLCMYMYMHRCLSDIQCGACLCVRVCTFECTYVHGQHTECVCTHTRTHTHNAHTHNAHTRTHTQCTQCTHTQCAHTHTHTHTLVLVLALYYHSQNCLHGPIN